MSNFIAIPLRKKYYNGEQVIKAVSKHVTDLKTLWAIFNSFSEMDGADMDDNDAYYRGFQDGVKYAIERIENHVDELLRRQK